MKKTNYETGWTEIAFIEVKNNSSYSFIGDFVCEISGEKLEKECLLVVRTNFKHRGNETDELLTYNRNSTPEKYRKVWEKWDAKKESKRQEIKQIKKQFNL